MFDSTKNESVRGNSQRNPSVEMLRCCLMFLIVLYHSWIHGIYGPNYGASIGGWIPFFFGTLCIFHVDAFVAISGRFGIRFSWVKFLKLYGMILFYSVLWIALLGIKRGSFNLHDVVINGGWFGSSYLVLMLLAPFLNAGVEGLYQTVGSKGLLKIWASLTLGVICTWLSSSISIGIYAEGWSAVSFATMVYMYLTARVFAVCKPNGLPLAFNIKMLAIFPVGIIVFGGAKLLRSAIIGQRIDLSFAMRSSCTTYLAPYVFLFAVALVFLFADHVKLPSKIGAIFVRIAPLMFGVYLFHDLRPEVRKMIWSNVQGGDVFYAVGEHNNLGTHRICSGYLRGMCSTFSYENGT